MRRIQMVLGALAVFLVGTTTVNAVETAVWDQGFESDASGWLDSDDAWYGSLERVASGTNGITSSEGSWHAEVSGDASSGPFSRFDTYRDTWPGSWTSELDVYLDPSWSSGEGFEYSVAASGSDGNHQRDYIFHVTKDTSSGELYVGGSNNTNFAAREDLESINHFTVTEAGWYTLQHVFYENAGALAVDLNLLDDTGTVVFTETRFNAADTIPAEVGGNRYAWFTIVNVPGGLAVDEHQLILDLPDTEPPVVSITEPVAGEEIRGMVDILGSVTDNDVLSHYNLSLYPGDVDLSDGQTHTADRLDDARWCSGTVSITDDVSGVLCDDWDTTAYEDGEYQIRLAARDAEGNRDPSDPYTGGTTSVHVISVTIDNVPDSADSCKKGGWEAFVSPSFKNQGDCVSYLNSNENAVGNKKNN